MVSRPAVDPPGARLLCSGRRRAVADQGQLDGTYRRAFEEGFVVYNPGTNGVSVSRASGAQTFPVGPQEGIILRHTAQGWVLVA